MPKQVWQSEDGKVFESEEECAAYEKIANPLRRLYDQDWEGRVESRLGLQNGFAHCLKHGFFSPQDCLKYRESFQRWADFLHGRLDLD